MRAPTVAPVAVISSLPWVSLRSGVGMRMVAISYLLGSVAERGTLLDTGWIDVFGGVERADARRRAAHRAGRVGVEADGADIHAERIILDEAPRKSGVLSSENAGGLGALQRAD